MVEALVALLLGLFVLHVGLSTLAHVHRAYASMTSRLDALTAGRIARTVLRRELGRGVAPIDWSASADSLRLRAFRGAGFVCAPGRSAEEVVVAYRGDRLPEPAKDSLEVTTVDGVTARFDLESRGAAAAPCLGADSMEVILRLGAPETLPAGAVLVRVFETGSYHFSGGALRYRVGYGGRQPLTPEVWQNRPTGFLPGDSTVRMRWIPDGPTGRSVSEFLAWAAR